MLSRVAERLFWGARYLERIENIARLVSVYDELLYDLPRDVEISWYNLIEINGCASDYLKTNQSNDENSILRYLLCELQNPSSMLTSLSMARENIRTSRDVLPEETWELINELDIYVKKHIKKAIVRGQRHSFLNTVIHNCQQISGLLTNAMSRDAGWSFINMGKYLERADMNTRILDSAISIKLNSQPEQAVLLEQVIWSKVLKSQSAYLNYLHSMQTEINGESTFSFLLNDENFPRSQAFCLNQIKHVVERLPRKKDVVTQVNRILSNTYYFEGEASISQDLSDYLNNIQLALIQLQSEIRETWFDFNNGDKA